MFKKLFNSAPQLPQLSDDAIVSPMNGEIAPITDVPDPVFGGKMMGDGFAITPTDGTVVSPVNGKIINIFPTKHAFGILGNNGHEILIHFGMDTVELKGQGFKALVKVGDVVKAGQPILKADIEFIQSQGKPIMTPIVFTNLEGKEITLKVKGNVVAGQENIIDIK